MKHTDLISMLPSVDNICKEADRQISELLADSTNNEKDHYRVAFRRSLEYIIRSITKDSPTYLNNDDRLKFAEWCIIIMKMTLIIISMTQKKYSEALNKFMRNLKTLNLYKYVIKI